MIFPKKLVQSGYIIEAFWWMWQNWTRRREVPPPFSLWTVALWHRMRIGGYLSSSMSCWWTCWWDITRKCLFRRIVKCVLRGCFSGWSSSVVRWRYTDAVWCWSCNTGWGNVRVLFSRTLRLRWLWRTNRNRMVPTPNVHWSSCSRGCSSVWR